MYTYEKMELIYVSVFGTYYGQLGMADIGG